MRHVADVARHEGRDSHAGRAHAGLVTGWRPTLLRRAHAVIDCQAPGRRLMGTHANNLENQQ